MDEANGGTQATPAGRRVWPIRRRGPVTAEDIAARELAAEEAGALTPIPEAAPVPLDETPPSRFDLAALRLAALGLALVLTVALTMVRLFVGGSPSVDDLRARSGVDGWSELTIGVKDDQPGVAYRDAAGIWSGFDIEIAHMIAEDLGFRRGEVKFYAIESEDRTRMQATDPKGRRVPVRMVIASFSITPERKARTGVTFSAPYLFTEQSVLTLKNHERVSNLIDLAGRQVCALTTSTSQTAAERAGVKLRSKNKISDCVADLRSGEVEAVTTDAAILAGYRTRHPDEFAHWDLGLDTVEAWGVNVGENDALQQLVDLTLYRSLKDPRDDRWETAYERNLQKQETRNPGTPIAQAQQPDVIRPDVRELPWEDVAP